MTGRMNAAGVPIVRGASGTGPRTKRARENQQERARRQREAERGGGREKPRDER